LVGLPRFGIARAIQSAVQAIIRSVSTTGGPNSFVACRVSVSQAVGSSLPVMTA